jgi:hypothetical protein
MGMFRRTLTRFALACSLACSVGAANAASAPEAGDYTALPPGTNLFLLYALHVTADDVYAAGNRVPLPGDLDLRANISLLRYVRFVKLGNMILDPQVIVPIAHQKVGLSGQTTSGLGDVIFGATLWPIANAETGENLGLTAFISAPTGSDKNHGFSVSNNRWATDLQVGYIRRLSKDWTIDLIGQTELYGDQRDTGLKKDALVRGFAHLRYFFNPGTYLAATYRHSWGAKETLAGATVATSLNDSYAQLAWASFLSPTTQLMVQYGRDLKVENGPKTQLLGARMLFVF